MSSKNSTIELSLKHLQQDNYGKIPEQPNEAVVSLAAPHVESFNFFLEEGLKSIVGSIPPIHFALPNGKKITIVINGVSVGKPKIPPGAGEAKDYNLYPKECFERGGSYTAPLYADVEWLVDQRIGSSWKQSLGDLPIIVMSKKCNLYGMSPKELVKHGELVNETGGYFISNGASKILRLLSSNRRNYPLAIVRESWKKRNDGFTDKGIMIRCVQDDQTAVMNVLHYLFSGEAKLQFTLNRQFFFIPLVLCLKALMDFTDLQIYNYLIRGRETNMYFSEKIRDMLRELQTEKLYNQKMCKDYIGKSFRHKVIQFIPEWFTDEEICDYLLNRYVLIHLKTRDQKFQTLCMMARKLYSFVSDECKAETVDAVSMQEVALGGHTYLQILKEKLMDWLVSMKIQITLKSKREGLNWNLDDTEFRKAAQKGKAIGRFFQTFVATGSLSSKTGCGLTQTNGLSIVIDHINRMRDLSHLRAIHRGAFFVDMKTIEPRRLTGEAWGFICPVHTPDGAPCGLLNHLAKNCIVLNTAPDKSSNLPKVLNSLGMMTVNDTPLVPYSECLEVMLDGILIGYIKNTQAEEFTHRLRILKTQEVIFKYTEIVLVPRRKYGGQYPALFLMTTMARMMRPVINLDTQTIEYIGTFEQLYLNVAVCVEDIEPGVHTHLEVDKTTIFSNIGKLVPFSDCNPNPRNMYQCQMGKQTMGTPLHNWVNQTASKVYRLQYPQVPLVRNAHYDEINMEEFCMGFNAVVAIVSYTGYDLEDAMILNKASMERGLAHGMIYKSEFVDLSLLDSKGRKPDVSEVNYVFRRDPEDANQKKFLDANGLPWPGTQLKEGDPYYCVYDPRKKSYRLTAYKGEDCVVDKYSIMAATLNAGECQRVNITIRIKRNPIIGDKFASRSGQKGIMSRLYPLEDLPFSERGIIPDIIFNPHGIPSRMTAGKLIELVAGKSAAEFGKSFDSTPFSFSDENPAVDYFGKILEKGGFNYYGEDVLYSGTDGRMMQVEIFEGIIYYQRLRHMTADKWQVRATGAVDLTTRQPIKGRKRGGAIRFGEMERDCLISHGAVYTLKDRLMDCSDACKEYVCEQCGDLLSPSVIVGAGEGTRKYGDKTPHCVLCGPSAVVRPLSLPYAFKFLVAELASVGIRTRLGVQGAEDIIRSKPKIKPIGSPA